MPNDMPSYAQAHKMRQSQNKSRVVIETPGVKDSTQGAHEATPEEIRREAIKNRGGAYSDRIKIEPKYQAPSRTAPLPSDTEIKKATENLTTKV